MKNYMIRNRDGMHVFTVHAANESNALHAFADHYNNPINGGEPGEAKVEEHWRGLVHVRVVVAGSQWWTAEAVS